MCINIKLNLFYAFHVLFQKSVTEPRATEIAELTVGILVQSYACVTLICPHAKHAVMPFSHFGFRFIERVFQHNEELTRKVITFSNVIMGCIVERVFVE